MPREPGIISEVWENTTTWEDVEKVIAELKEKQMQPYRVAIRKSRQIGLGLVESAEIYFTKIERP